MRTSTVVKSLAIGVATAALVALSSSNAFAVSNGDVYAATSNGSGSLARINPLTGEVISLVPTGANFPSTSNGLRNISGLSFNSVDGLLYGLNYGCEIITINVVTGASTPVATAPSGAGSCQGLSITPTGEILVGFGTTVKKYDSASNSYLALAGAPVFSAVRWLSLEPVSGLIYVGDDIAPNTYNMVVKTMSTTGASVVTVAADGNTLSSVAFSSSGEALGGYFGSRYYTGLTSTFPLGMTRSSASSGLSNDYYIAGYFTSAPAPSPSVPVTPQSTTLANTGVSIPVLSIASALGIVALGSALLLSLRKKS